MVPVTAPYNSQSGMAAALRGMAVPMPTASSESPTDMARLPQALIGLWRDSSAGRALSSSALLGYEGAPAGREAVASDERSVGVNVKRDPQSSAETGALFFLKTLDGLLGMP